MSKSNSGPSTQSIRLHEILTPLTHIIGFADLLLEELDKSSKEEIRGDVEKIKKAADQMLAVIQADRTPAAESEKVVTLQETAALKSDENQGNVLVVDDDANNRILIARNLRKRGYKVAEASDGMEALEILKTNSFDLILCDIVMPQMDGVALLKHLQSQFRDIPVMVISALDEMDVVEQCMDLDAVDFITKPFEPYILLAKVRATIRRKHLRDRGGKGVAL